MKTVLIFDTEDPKGMENTIKIVNHLTKQYFSSLTTHRSLHFGRIEFIKMLRTFMQEGSERTPEERKSLNFAKRFCDRVWKEKESITP
jgi:hypothetical protein